MEYNKRGKARTIWGGRVQQSKHVSKDAVPTRACVMELVPWGFIIPKVDELACIQIEMIRPVLVLTAGIEDYEFLIVPAPRTPETTEVPDSWQETR